MCDLVHVGLCNHSQTKDEIEEVVDSREKPAFLGATDQDGSRGKPYATPTGRLALVWGGVFHGF